MNTGAQTARPSSESGSAATGSARAMSYVPGAPVAPRRLQARGKVLRRKQVFSGCPPDVIERIVEYLMESRAVLAIMTLSMVNKGFRAGISANMPLWHKLYLLWRGPLKPAHPELKARNTIYLAPTLPRTLPNFRMKSLPLA